MAVNEGAIDVLMCECADVRILMMDRTKEFAHPHISTFAHQLYQLDLKFFLNSSKGILP